MDDLISRQMALELVRALPSWPTVLDNLVDRAQVQTELMMLPAAEPKKGKWVQDWRDERGYTHISGYKCTECDALYPWKTNYCPDCGARMKEKD